MIDVKWDTPLDLFQRSLYLMKSDGFRVVVKGHVATMIGRSLRPHITVILKDDSKISELIICATDEQESLVLSTLQFIGAGKIMKDEISSGRLVITGPEEKMRWIVNKLTREAEVTDRPSGTLPVKPHHGQNHKDDDGKSWVYNSVTKKWTSWPPIPA